MIKTIFEKEALTLVFFGDSITHGYFESHENMHGTTDYEAVYHHQLLKMLETVFPQKRFCMVNSGVGGENAKMALNRLERDVIEKKPDLAVVCFGLNDILSENEEAYVTPLEQIFSGISEKGIPAVFLTPNMLNTRPTEGFLHDFSVQTAAYQNEGKMDRFINAAVQMAHRENIRVCDCYQKWKRLAKCGIDTNLLLANGVNHPIRQMHLLFAKSLFETMLLDERD